MRSVEIRPLFLMEGDYFLPIVNGKGYSPLRTLQTSLSDMNGGARGASFEPRLGMDHTPLAIGLLSSPSLGVPTPVYSREGVGPNLSCLHLHERHVWVLAHYVFSKNHVLRQVKTAELMAMWDYEGKLESCGWSREQCL